MNREFGAALATLRRGASAARPRFERALGAVLSATRRGLAVALPVAARLTRAGVAAALPVLRRRPYLALGGAAGVIVAAVLAVALLSGRSGPAPNPADTGANAVAAPATSPAPDTGPAVAAVTTAPEPSPPPAPSPAPTASPAPAAPHDRNTPIDLAGAHPSCFSSADDLAGFARYRDMLEREAKTPLGIVIVPADIALALLSGSGPTALRACRPCGGSLKISACLATDATVAQARELVQSRLAGGPPAAAPTTSRGSAPAGPAPAAPAAPVASAPAPQGSNAAGAGQNCTYTLSGVKCGTIADADQVEIGKCKARIFQRVDAGAHLYCEGIFAQYGVFKPADQAAAFQDFTQAAERGNVDAEARLGLDYEHGLGGAKRDPALAAAWYDKAARQGHPGAALNLGLMYERGEGVAKDDARARSLIEAAAAQGFGPALRKLAELNRGARPATPAPAEDLWNEGKKRYLAGDHPGAAKILMQAAEAGNPAAEEMIGYMYENGDGLPKALPEAVRWYKQAALQGNGLAANALGSLYEDGQGVPDDWDAAAYWYRKSAEAGTPQGMVDYGRAFQFGIGVPQNRWTAIRWFQSAAGLGNGQAAYFAKQLSDPMNSAGARNDAEQRYFFSSGRLHWLLATPDPAGAVFHNSRERWAYWVKIIADKSCKEAQALWQLWSKEYEDCRHAGRESCFSPGKRPC